ncbi:UNVERIFIED_CONTAM: hypothetical protein HDU68_005062 [Siphonaria sp. JEL0065]|nr:hypothetical protein HDU68_005062 [Siphonaria sp. JEL0065]
MLRRDRIQQRERSAGNAAVFGHVSDVERFLDSLLLFAPPSHVALAIAKTISPRLKSVYALGIPNIRSAGFLYTSADLHLDHHHQSLDESADSNFSSITSATSDANIFAREVVATDFAPTPTDPSPYHTLMYGRLFEDYRLEALISQKLGTRNMFVVSGISAWETDGHSHVEAQYIHKDENWCTDVTYSSADNVFGTSCHVRIPYTNWSAGGEVIYTASEKSGGS